MKSHQDTWLYGALTLVLFLLFGISLSTGPAMLHLNPVEILQSFSGNSEASVILREIRLPRTLLGLLIGFVFGLCGASMQGYLRNPLAEPGILGVSGGAVLGAVAVFYTGLSVRWPMALPLAGMIGAFISVWLVYLLAGSKSSVATLILAGAALNILSFALTTLFLNLVKNPYARLEIVFWQQGSIADRSMDHFLLAAPWMIAGSALLFWTGKSLDALSLGEETAASLGIRLGRVRILTLLGTALAVGGAVSLCGNIAFVGLMVPHLMRPWARQEPSRLLGLSALAGACVLLAADILVRMIPTDQEIKLGVLTSLVGAPFFLGLVLQIRKRGS